MTYFMSVLIWGKTVCKGYKQMTKVSAGSVRVNFLNFLFQCME